MRQARRLPPEELAPYLVETPPAGTRLDWAALFGNANPVEVEVGFGKGLFLLTASEASPDVNFLGIEVERKYQLFTATRLAKRRRSNVRLACADARVLLRDALPPESVQAIHVYFPDPWWKKRHHKRRLFNAEFVAAGERVLCPGGRLEIATDVEEYHHTIVELVSQRPALRGLPAPEPSTPAHHIDYLTNFERKFRQQGKPIFRTRAERTLAPA